MLYDGIKILEGSDIKNATIASGNAFPANPSVGELFYISGGATPVGLYVYTTQNAWIKTLVTGEGGGSLPDIITPAIYKSVTVNSKGLVTSGTNPTTLEGYGITDALPISGGTLAGNLNSPNGTKITAAVSPTDGIDVANKAYVDAAVAGLSWKPAVRVATTENITLSGAQTIDGVAVRGGARVLVKNQTTASQNGIYQVGTPWVRATDADTGAEIFGASLFVQQGTLQADTAWVCSNDTAPNIGSTAINFVQFNAGGSSVNAGSGLTLSGNILSVNMGAGIAALPTNEVGVEVYPGGGLMTTINNTSSSTTSAARLALTDSGVIPASYTRPTLNIDAKGRITSASNGTLDSLQNVYENNNASGAGIINIDSSRGPFVIRAGSIPDSTGILAVRNSGSTTTFSVTGNGAINAASYTGELVAVTRVSYTAPFNISAVSGNITIPWANGHVNVRQPEPTGNITYAFTAPSGPARLQVFIDSDGTSPAVNFTWPANVIWMGSQWTQVANKKAIVNLWYDGTNYYAAGMNQA